MNALTALQREKKLSRLYLNEISKFTSYSQARILVKPQVLIYANQVNEKK